MSQRIRHDAPVCSCCGCPEPPITVLQYAAMHEKRRARKDKKVSNWLMKRMIEDEVAEGQLGG